MQECIVIHEYANLETPPGPPAIPSSVFSLILANVDSLSAHVSHAEGFQLQRLHVPPRCITDVLNRRRKQKNHKIIQHSSVSWNPLPSVLSVSTSSFGSSPDSAPRLSLCCPRVFSCSVFHFDESVGSKPPVSWFSLWSLVDSYHASLSRVFPCALFIISSWFWSSSGLMLSSRMKSHTEFASCLHEPHFTP